MVGLDKPHAVLEPLDAAAAAPDRFEPADMGLGEAHAGGGIEHQVKINAVKAAIDPRDLGDQPIRPPGPGLAGTNPDNRALGQRFHALASSDVDMVHTPVDAIDEQEVPVLKLVHQASRDHSAKNACFGHLIVMDGAVRRKPLEALSRKLALHGADDVAALAEAPQLAFDVCRKPPLAAAERLGEAESAKLLQPAGAKRMLEWIAVGRRHGT